MAIAEDNTARDDARGNSYLAGHPDRELIILGHGLEAAIKREFAMDWQCEMSDQAYEALIADQVAIADAIAACGARTLRGLAVQALALHWCTRSEPAGPEEGIDSRLTRKIKAWLLSPAASEQPSPELREALGAVEAAQDEYDEVRAGLAAAESGAVEAAGEAACDDAYDARREAIMAFIAMPCATPFEAAWKAYHALPMLELAADEGAAIDALRASIGGAIGLSDDASGNRNSD